MKEKAYAMMSCGISLEQKPVESEADHGKRRIVSYIITGKKCFQVKVVNIFIVQQDISIIPAYKIGREQFKIHQYSEQA